MLLYILTQFFMHFIKDAANRLIYYFISYFRSLIRINATPKKESDCIYCQSFAYCCNIMYPGNAYI